MQFEGTEMRLLTCQCVYATAVVLQFGAVPAVEMIYSFRGDGGCCTVIVVQRQTGQICENLKGKKCVRSKDVENKK